MAYKSDTKGMNFFLFSGFTFTDVSSVRASTSKVACCHFSSDGKLLASGGHDKKVGGSISVDNNIYSVLALFNQLPEISSDLELKNKIKNISFLLFCFD